MGPEGAALIKSLGKKIQDKTCEKRSTFFLFQSISMAIQRGNAMGTPQLGQNLDEIYYLSLISTTCMSKSVLLYIHHGVKFMN